MKNKKNYIFALATFLSLTTVSSAADCTSEVERAALNNCNKTELDCFINDSARFLRSIKNKKDQYSVSASNGAQSKEISYIVTTGRNTCNVRGVVVTDIE